MELPTLPAELLLPFPVAANVGGAGLQGPAQGQLQAEEEEGQWLHPGGNRAKRGDGGGRAAALLRGFLPPSCAPSPPSARGKLKQGAVESTE